MTSAVLDHATKATRFYVCQFEECPNKGTLIKMRRNKAGRPPLYHPECAVKAAAIKKDRNDPRSPRFENPHQSPRSLEEAAYGGPKCGAPRSQKSALASTPGPCSLPAGWGTTHVGFGHCKLHLGNSPSGTVHAAKEMLIRDAPVFGNPIEIDPHGAVLQEIQRTSGHIEWLRIMIAAIGLDGNEPHAGDVYDLTGFAPEGMRRALIQLSEKGQDPSVWVNMYQRERAHLVQTCKAAVQMGCAERTVQLAEGHGRIIATVIMNVLRSPQLNLTNAQMVHVPELVRAELQAIETTGQEALPA